jgi:hypothetical protein
MIDIVNSSGVGSGVGVGVGSGVGVGASDASGSGTAGISETTGVLSDDEGFCMTAATGSSRARRNRMPTRIIARRIRTRILISVFILSLR